MVSQVELPDDPKTAKHFLDAKNKEKELELGIMGKYLGGPTVSPIVITGLAIFVLFGILVTVLFADITVEGKEYIITLVFSTLTLAFGYLFGRSSG